MPEDRPTMSAQEAAAYLGISKPTMLRLWTQGLLTGYRVTPYPNERVRIYRDSVELFDSQRKNQAPQADTWFLCLARWSASAFLVWTPYASGLVMGFMKLLVLERETGFEPATYTLARCRSTN
ncbi:MAG: hypothetical protein GFH27_549303n263 [Chloroflexi bacterium AL-W]|nr:hypothetical protein [Chloroflexi bacterium AL-N1]NOK68148.1 hypothetical protein [Chloroflexi bacterium AL-N10]NOK73488.1 hypothetical protein [Chloroflexi bacterium AL-N5]NOK83402.1 hypothetical protein [Chloroflexi bacterium AL-W]NOK87819.1 hypothetical protein [Chloroflexi bacterium AL-N15]